MSWRAAGIKSEEVRRLLVGEPREVTVSVPARWYSRPGRAIGISVELFRREGYRLERIVAAPGVWFATFERIRVDS